MACNKNKDAVSIPYSQASYKIIITMNWSSPNLTVPAGAHVTAITGMVHSKDTFLWAPGKLATPGLEDMAEIGATAKMNAELDSILLKSRALSKFTIQPPAVNGSAETILNFNTFYPYISFASMIAPSPDWFMGVHDFSLFNGSDWINDITLNLMLYDAGTEEGDVFGYNNPATSPQQNISLLTPAGASVLANGNATLAAIGTIRFIKN